eukprot:TRINITY_DN6635_c0_g1_i1.p1 TRINITY_DN6635_c0_g1~~TRINITY_DN6635_c0_g1_i1.p1  ORF type:complete len:358 (+),score=141.95 TRINITY_DN6635_c0_g1_i1:68-1075(+)
MTEETQQTASVKFSEAIPSGFEAVAVKTDNGLTIVKDWLEFFKSRAKLEAEYAKQLIAFYKVVPGTGVFTKVPAVTKESKTLRDVLQGSVDTGSKIAEQHQTFANAIINDIAKPLDAWLKAKEVERRKIVEDGKKQLGALSNARSSVAKAKDNYERANKDAEAAKDTELKLEADVKAGKKGADQQLTRAVARYTELADKATKAEAAYKETVSKSNEEIDAQKTTKLPAVLETFQAWDTDRWNTLLNAVKTFKTLQDATPPVFEKSSTDLTALLEAASLETDLTEFIDATKAGEKDLFAPTEFIKFKGKYTTDDSSASAAVEEVAEEKKEEEAAES